eukprot:GGOE01053212.1.p1 GENE.GGOE01053212.1~~GGOE01053212.1.p1  ORF type:complete len:416 (+),score=151.50 GGOE01053212.1:101-1348(+)
MAPGKSNFFHKIRNREELAKSTAQVSYFTPSLVELCARAVAEDFPNQRSINNLKAELQAAVLARLSPALPIAVTVPRVQSEEYWKKCCESRWSTGQLAEARGEMQDDFTWKRLYLERYTEDYLAGLTDEYPSSPASTVELAELLQLVSPWIQKLHIPRLRCHLDMDDLVASLPKMRSLRVTYGVLNCGMQFDAKMFGIRPADCLQFASILRHSKVLTTLSLPESQVDSDKLKALITGLVKNFTVTRLDLSHNKIPDTGARALATLLLRKQQTIEHLNLMDNVIRSEGGAALGRSLAVNSCLVSLNLRLNRLGDEGGAGLFDGLRTNATLKELNVANNDLGAESARRLGEALRQNGALTALDLAGNAFGEAAGPLLVDAVEANASLLTFDIRLSGLREEDRFVLADTVKQRQAKPV